MIIGIDGNEANVEHLVGVSVYTHRLLEYFHSKSTESLQFTVYLKEPPCSHMPKQTEYFTYTVIPGPFLWSRIFFPIHLLSNKPDVLFCPAHYSPPAYTGKLVVTIHDLSYYYFPDEFLKKDLYKLKNWTADSIKKADRIIAVSKTTKKDIAREFHDVQAPVTVVYNGFDTPERKKESGILKKLNLEENQFLLFVGTLQPRKNASILIEALQLLHLKEKKLKLVLVGKQGWLYEDIMEKAHSSDVADSILFTGYLPDEDVQTLYKKALCFVHPSLYEGFGIPVLEAMAGECPVICSQESSLPEIAGDAALYFDPRNAQQLSEQVQRLLHSKTLANELIGKGLDRISLFSWDQCGEETLRLIKEVASS